MEGAGQHGSRWLSAPRSDLSPSRGGGHRRAHAESEDAWQPRAPGERRCPLHRGATAAKGHQRRRGGVWGARRTSGRASACGWHHHPVRLAPSRRLAPALCTPHPSHGPRPEPSRPPGGEAAVCMEAPRPPSRWSRRAVPRALMEGEALVPLLGGLPPPLPGQAFSRGAPWLL